MKHLLALSLFSLFFTTSSLLGQCEGFSNYPLGESAGKRNHYDYRQDMKKGNIADAIPRWRKAMQYTPAGSPYHYIDGVDIYEYLMKKETDEAQRLALRDSMFALFDQRIQCTAKTTTKKGDILTRKAYTMYKHGADEMETYQTYKEGIQLVGKKVKSFTVYPFAYLTVELFKQEKIDRKEAQEIHQQLEEIITYNLEKGKKESDKFKFQELADKVDNVFFQDMESAIFDCDYYMSIYVPMYQANPDSVELYRSVYTALYNGGCARTIAIMQEIRTKDSIYVAREKEQAFAAAKAAAPKSKKAFWAYQDEDYAGSAQFFYEAALEEEGLDEASRAEMCFKAAQISFANLKNYPKARDYAEKALEYRPSWGKPYLLIGDLYASSGPLCGTGTGFKSQVVTWAAIDMWKKAKEVDSDPFVQKKAKAQIAKYTKFMPTAEDLHLRKLKEGETYTIPCWIQRPTKVRAYNPYENP